jgi:hypothetical protein
MVIYHISNFYIFNGGINMTFEKLVDNIIDKLFDDMLNRGQFIDDNVKQEIRKSWKSIIITQCQNIQEVETDDILKQIILDYFKQGGFKCQ